MKPPQIQWKWLLLGLVVLLLIGLAVLPRQIGTTSGLRDRVAAALSAWTGATITLTEPLSIQYFPPLSLQGGFVLTNATKLPLIDTLTAKDARISLSLPDLLMGRVKVEALRLNQPKITLKDSAVTEKTADKTLEALVLNMLAGAPVRIVRVRGGTIETALDKVLTRDLDARFDASPSSGALGALGSFTYRGETVRFAIDSSAISEVEGEQVAPVTMTVTSAPVTAEFSGTARLGEFFLLDGEMQTEMNDARSFLNWVGMGLPQGESLRDLSASGTVHWKANTLTFDDGTFSLDGNKAIGLLAVTTGERPRVEGTLAFERLVLDPYLGTDAAKSAAANGALFDWVLLKHFDADLRISAAEIAASAMTLGHGGFTITAKDGVISGEVGELELCGGQAAGRVGLDLSSPRADASFVGDLSDVAIDACLEPFALGIPMKGVGTLKADIATGGTTHDELIRGLTGNFKVVVQDGAVPVNLPQLMAGTESDDSGWSRDSATPFKSLNADCRLSAGHIWCQVFNMKTRGGRVSGSGAIDVGKQTLDWDFLIANPVAPLNASQLVMEAPPRVTIRGSLTQPLIQRANRSTLGDRSTQTGSGSAPITPR